MSASAICEGEVFHRRFLPRPHAFRVRLFLLSLDLDRMPSMLLRPWSPLRFRRADYLGPPDVPLREAVLDRVAANVGRRPAGAVHVLTHLRTFGYVFNPVTFYFCHDWSGALDVVVAEITNTPWRERHAYVLDARQGVHGNERSGGESGNPADLVWRFDKAFHVSPFLPMRQAYEWRLRRAGDRLEIHMTNEEDGRRVFEAGLSCERRSLSLARLASVLARYPLLTLRLHAAIYGQALRLWLKRTPTFVHPRKRVSPSDAATSPC